MTAEGAGMGTVIQGQELAVRIPDEQVAEAGAEVGALVQECRALRIADQATEQRAAELATAASKLRKRIDAVRDALVRPLREHVERINSMFKTTLGPLAEAEQYLKDDRLRYLREQEAAARRIREERDRLEREAAETARKLREANVPASVIAQAVPAVPAAPAPEPPAKLVRADSGAGFTEVTDYVPRIVNLALVPLEFHQIDLTAVKRARGRYPNGIPGVEFDEVKSTRLVAARRG